MECEKGKGEDLLEILWIWQKSGMAENRFGDHIPIFKVLKPNTQPGQTELKIFMNAIGRRFQNSVNMVSLVRLVDPNMVVEVRASPTDKTKKAKVPISELILHQPTTDNTPIVLLLTKNYNFYIQLYTKKGMYLGDCPDGYLVNSLPEAKDVIYKAFLPFSVEAA